MKNTITEKCRHEMNRALVSGNYFDLYDSLADNGHESDQIWITSSKMDNQDQVIQYLKKTIKNLLN